MNIGDEKITSLAGCMFSRVFLCVDIGVFRKADFNLFKRTIESFALYFVICMILSDITIVLHIVVYCYSILIFIILQLQYKNWIIYTIFLFLITDFI